MPAQTVYSGLDKSDFTGGLHNLLIRRIALEVEVIELQPQFRFTANTDLEKHVFQVGFDSSDRDTHLESDLRILVSQASVIRDLLFPRG